MAEKKAETRSIYTITHRELGIVQNVAAPDAQTACQRLGWEIGDCHVFKQEPAWHHSPGRKSAFMVKVPCRVCTWQYASCSRRKEEVCPVQVNAQEVTEWLKQTCQAHLCKHVGAELTRKDYDLRQIWLPLPQAIQQLIALDL